jgi:hypothetical protein
MHKYHAYPVRKRRKMLVRLTKYLDKKLGSPKIFEKCRTDLDSEWWYVNAKVDGMTTFAEFDLRPMLRCWLHLALDCRL